MTTNVLRIVEDPLSVFSQGGYPASRWVAPAEVQVGRTPKTVANWDYYDGAIVAVGFTDGEIYTACGSGVVVAPGLILTATHVVDPYVTAVEKHQCSLYCVGIKRGGSADLWRLRRLRYPEDESDIAFLSVELNSAVTREWAFTLLPLSTRAPRKGDRLTIVGFRFDNPQAAEADGGVVSALSTGNLYVAAGACTALYPYRRDSVMAPFPLIEIDCGTLGGMSGGAVLNHLGEVVGILSTGIDRDEMTGPSNAAWIIHALMFRVDLSWPPGMYVGDQPILEIPESSLHIVGRDKARLIDEQQVDYTLWS